MDGSILEEVKGIGHLPFGDPPRLQRLSEVRPAAPVAFYSVVEPVAPIVTHRGDDVIPADVIPDDLEHRTPPVAFNLVPDLGGQPQHCRTGMRGRQPLGPVARRERDEVGDLLPLEVDDLNQLASTGNERRTVTAGNEDLLPRCISAKRNGLGRIGRILRPSNASFGHGKDCASYITLSQASIPAHRTINGRRMCGA